MSAVRHSEVHSGNINADNIATCWSAGYLSAAVKHQTIEERDGDPEPVGDSVCCHYEL